MNVEGTASQILDSSSDLVDVTDSEMSSYHVRVEFESSGGYSKTINWH